MAAVLDISMIGHAENLETWIDFLGIENLNGRGMASSLFINRGILERKPNYLLKSFVSGLFPCCHVSFSFLCQMEERKVEKMVVRLSQFGSLFGIIYQSS